MELARPLNLMDADSLVQDFLREREQGIATLHRTYFKGSDQLSLRALKEELVEELRTGCVTFINKNHPMEELYNYLFYIVNDFCKKTAEPIVKKVTEYICPGCVFLGKEYCAINMNKVFKCDECEFELKNATDPKRVQFFRTFYQHNKVGYHCPDCSRFIPHPMDNAVTTVSCPYFDCFFVGPIINLDKMHHPTSKSNPEKLILDSPATHGVPLKDHVLSKEVDAQTQLEVAEDLQDKFDILQEIIETQSNNVPYCSSDATIRHKQYVYQAFSSLLEESPTEMVAYLLNSNDNHLGFQHRVFQKYIKLLEDSLPFAISKNRKLHKVESLLDETLCLFDGISVYDSVVTDKLSIKNETTEFYIGGRKATYTKPYYIGKLLNVIHKDTKVSLMQHVKDYSFSRIRVRDIVPGTPVTVTHLRVPPHYQMGGMAYVNRIRKKIVERAKAVINHEQL
jgi:hypothetical protein